MDRRMALLALVLASWLLVAASAQLTRCGSGCLECVNATEISNATASSAGEDASSPSDVLSAGRRLLRRGRGRGRGDDESGGDHWAAKPPARPSGQGWAATCIACDEAAGYQLRQHANTTRACCECQPGFGTVYEAAAADNSSSWRVFKRGRANFTCTACASLGAGLVPLRPGSGLAPAWDGSAWSLELLAPNASSSGDDWWWGMRRAAPRRHGGGPGQADTPLRPSSPAPWRYGECVACPAGSSSADNIACVADDTTGSEPETEQDASPSPSPEPETEPDASPSPSPEPETEPDASPSPSPDPETEQDIVEAQPTPSLSAEALEAAFTSQGPSALLVGRTLNVPQP